MTWRLVIHGGAGAMRPKHGDADHEQRAREGLRAALEAGGHLHLGLEFFAGSRVPTNAELVAEAVALCEELGRPVATPDQAAQLLDLPRGQPATSARN